jgi:hypothetical protein
MRTYLRDSLRIGQRYQRKSRKRDEQYIIVIYQIHRHDKQVRAYREDEPPEGILKALFPVNFATLKDKYRRLDEDV